MEIQQFPLWDKIKNKRIPLSFDLEITARCNLNCRHCYINLPAGDKDARAQELGAAEIMDIARQAFADGEGTAIEMFVVVADDGGAFGDTLTQHFCVDTGRSGGLEHFIGDDALTGEFELGHESTF